MNINNKKASNKINFFDLIILAVVIIAIIVISVMYYSKEKKVVNNATKMTYVLELVSNPLGFSELIKVGDNLSDSVKNFPMGKVINVEKTPQKTIVNDLVNNIILENEIPDKERVVLTVEADVVDNGTDLLIENSYDIRVGKDIYVKGNGYAGVGYILEIKRD